MVKCLNHFAFLHPVKQINFRKRKISQQLQGKKWNILIIIIKIWKN